MSRCHGDLKAVYEWSGSFTVRVLPVPTGPLGPSAEAVHERFAPFGLGGEAYSAQLPLVALNLPADADLAAIKALLTRGEDEDLCMLGRRMPHLPPHNPLTPQHLTKYY